MKVGILTWYKAINHGAVLQTYASCKVLESLGCDPVVLDFDWEIEDEKKENKWEKIKRRISSVTPAKIFWYLNVKKNLKVKIEAFSGFIEEQVPVGNKYNEEKNLDAVYIGSDMVFDITEGYNPYMYGVGVPANYIFSYAASFGYTTYEKIMKSVHKTEIVDALARLKSIGYRDENTVSLCNKLGNSVPKEENIDPVLLYGFQDEMRKWDSGKWKKEDYILVYAYDSTMNDNETIKQVKKLAREENLKIISCGYYHKWCDESVPASPTEFLEMFIHAKYIITDTFHGTVFSLICHKNFASIIRKNGFKVKHLLDATHLENRIVKGEIADIVNSNPNFTYFDEWTEKERTRSRKFIEKNINAAS